MLKGIMSGLSSAIGLYMFCHKELEQFYVNGMREVFGQEVTLASFFVLMAVAGGISEVFQHIRQCCQYAYHTAKQKNKNGVEKRESNKQCESNTITTDREPTNQPSIPSKSSKPSVPSQPKQI